VGYDVIFGGRKKKSSLPLKGRKKGKILECLRKRGTNGDRGPAVGQGGNLCDLGKDFPAPETETLKGRQRGRRYV